MRRLAVDTSCTVAFFTAFAAFSELVVAGMEPSAVLWTRIVMVPIMIASARPYTLWRDWLMARVAPRGRLTATATDVAAFLSFQVPVYAATLAGAGADGAQIGAAVGSAVVFMILLARPFGLFVDGARHLFGVATEPRADPGGRSTDAPGNRLAPHRPPP
jgi:hypothetical protein